ncbi:Activator of stress1 [Fusarium oxysporum f. sp. albedinis]|nr:Activator of stress1 [Fusarium oxysporum f. sp. albedinis]
MIPVPSSNDIKKHERPGLLHCLGEPIRLTNNTQMGSHCKVGNGTRDWTKEEMMSYLDWDRAENDRVEQSVEIEMAEQPFSRRRGMQDIWDAAERDIMLQESIFQGR